ncbi:mucosa-associated lymphoid tissue lymphoma translocation protein 1-like [Polyodon spathula]|uniref:mucosa-associated lymphoid tissue lymphoma translocation protein 1-like n=1 Tax=Polyodon spathula TaxID=7913 RepID=UPI001B7EE55F|nr:mucosa-associated lymphoid tissue lymphoma translocation protein 1-like [Polyodon spathula]
MVIYTSLVKKPDDMTSCEASITNFILDLDVDPKETNKVTPEETGSYLLSKSLPEHCLYTKLSSLQKLKGSFPLWCAFTASSTPWMTWWSWEAPHCQVRHSPHGQKKQLPSNLSHTT